MASDKIKKTRIRPRLVVLFLLLFSFFEGEVGTNLFARQITDMAGRRVTIPARLSRVIPYDNKTNVILFPIAGSQMIAKARSMENPSLKYISKDFLKLREVDTKNAEEVIKLKPDLLIVAAFASDREDLVRYEAFSKKVNIPLVVVDLELMRLDKSFEFLGQLLGKSVDAATLSAFIRSIYQEAAHYKVNKRIAGRAYVANDNDGLRTVPQTSNHAQLFEEMGIPNAVKAPLNAKGFALVSMEQILAWNPNYIFCIGKGEACPYRTILKSALWRNITAVKTKRVFWVPDQPYSWFDMPPSVNRLLGLVWFSDLFYGQPNNVTRDKVKEFYRLFYKYNLTDKEYARLFMWR